METTTLLTGTPMVALLAVPMFAQVTPTDETVPCRNYRDVLTLFERLGYTAKAWHAGIREIPRVYLADVPDTWREPSAKKLSVADKKNGLHRRASDCIPPLAPSHMITEGRGRLVATLQRRYGRSIRVILD